MQERIKGSLWTKGTFGLVAGGAIIVGLLIWVPAVRWFLGISVVIGLAMAGIIHWWNEHHAVKTEDEEQIRLGLLDDDERSDRVEKH